MERQISAFLLSAALSTACSPDHFDKSKFSDSDTAPIEDSSVPSFETADSGETPPYVTDLLPWNPASLDTDVMEEIRELVVETLGENISPSGLTYDPSTDELIVTSDNPGWEFHLNASSGALVFALPLTGDPEAVTLLPDGTILRVNEDYREEDPEVIVSAFYRHGVSWENTLACIPEGGVDETGGMEGAAYVPADFLPDRFAAPEGVILTVGEYSRSPYFDAAACMGEDPALTPRQASLRAGTQNYTGASFLEETGYVYLLSNDSSLGIDVYDPATGRWVMNYTLPETLSDPDGMAVYKPDCTTGYASLALAEGASGQVFVSDQFPIVCRVF